MVVCVAGLTGLFQCFQRTQFFSRKPMNSNQKLIEMLACSEMFQNYERAFNELTGMPLALRSVEAGQLPPDGRGKQIQFCTDMAGKNCSCSACQQLEENLARDAMNGPATMTCACGRHETAAPVKLGRKTIGFLQTGQILRAKAAEAAFHQTVDDAGKIGAGMANETAKWTYSEPPFAAQKKLDSLSILLATFADHLSMKSNEIAMQTAINEPPVITRAKQFIREHLTEDLSLGQVSNAVNASYCHFCKRFRKATGQCFTEFVSRTRIEKAKNLLLNRNLLICAIAFDAGFQSVTHFNRVFKKVAGQSPTEYRRRLPVAA